jgi:hypothetical protein
MKKLLIAICLLAAAGCASTGPVTNRPSIQRQVGKTMVLAAHGILVEGRNGVIRLEELKAGSISGDRVIAKVDLGHAVEVIGAVYRSRPLQLRYHLKVRLTVNGQEIIAECRTSRAGRSILKDQ